MKNVLIVMVLSATLSRCATNSGSSALGGAIGASTGAILGGIADPGKEGEYRTRNVIVGTALGGMAGMISGSIIHENTENKKQEAFLMGKRSTPTVGTTPALQNAKVEARWMESKVVGNRFIEGHFEYVIVEPSRWDVSE